MDKSEPEHSILEALAARLEEMGFLGYQEPIMEWISDGYEAWEGGVHEMLAALKRTVWQDYSNAGETPPDWLDEHPKPHDYDFENWLDYERELAAWKKAALEAAKEPYYEAEGEIIAAGKAIRSPHAREAAEKREQNPFVVAERDGTYTIGFSVPRLTEPLWWTGQGFKNLARVRLDPEFFPTKQDATDKIQTELLGFIRRWREDDEQYVTGW